MSLARPNRRNLFLTISAVSAVLILFLIREVLFPFVLAVIVAYVLTPLVAYLERRRVPRPWAIIGLYVVILGTLVGGVVLAAPHVYEECIRIKDEVPARLKTALETGVPALERKLSGLIGSSGADTQGDAKKEPDPILLVEPDSSGALRVHMQAPIDIVRDDPNHFRIQGPSAGGGKFDPAALLADLTAQSLEYVKRNAVQLLQLGKAIVGSTTRMLILMFATLACAAYIMQTRDVIWNFFRSLVPRTHWDSFDRLMTRIDEGLAGVIRGQLLICLVNGILSAIGFALFGLKYWIVLSFVAAALSIIPIFGAFLSSVPAVAVGLTQDIWTTLWVLLWILGIHQLEANLLNPKIIGDAAKLHPVLVVMSLVAGEHFYGLAGALLAVPALSLLQSVFNHFRFELFQLELVPTAEPPNSTKNPTTPAE
ncbi:MAG TPA: AI-2E family transporter [Polyangiaceae bacterium]|jgi:predicted PurR-regulated permease PerM|nr:AI-2E family transporter [Polyangiaceae bacterium]